VTTKYTFDYRERAYYTDPKWNAYFFTWEKKYAEKCSDSTFDCNTFEHNKHPPQQSLHRHQFTSETSSDGYEPLLMSIPRYLHVLNIYYHNYPFAKSRFPIKQIPWAQKKEFEFYTEFIRCLNTGGGRTPEYCVFNQINGYWRYLLALVLEPYWKLTVIYGKYTGEVLDHFMTCHELPQTFYMNEDIKVCNYMVCLCIQ